LTITVFSKYLYIDYEYNRVSVVSAGEPPLHGNAICAGEGLEKRGAWEMVRYGREGEERAGTALSITDGVRHCERGLTDVNLWSKLTV